MKPEKLIVALDVETLKKAEALVEQLKPEVSIFKIGSILFTRYGPEVVKMVQKKGGKVFLDLKYHDIPHTVSKAVEQACGLEVFALTLHTLGGFTMLKEAVKSAHKIGTPVRRNLDVGGRPFLWGVTVLTSLKEGDLFELGMNREIGKEVKRLAKMAKNAGLDGVVASAREAPIVRRTCGKDFQIVVPGIRPPGYSSDEHKRAVTPKEAIEAGANYIVVGRPIIQAKDPLAVVNQILSTG